MKINSRCTFNKIFILDAPIRKGESKSGLELHKWLNNRAQQSGITCERIEIPSKKVLLRELNKLATAAEQEGLVPLIHFEAHGNPKSGMEVRPGEFIQWESLLTLTRRINIATSNNLILSFAVCNAGFVYPEIDIHKPAPFFGFVGSIQELHFGAMEVGYNSFFDSMLSTNNLNKALMAMNMDYEQELGVKPEPNVNPTFDFKLAEKFFEDLFLSVAKEWENSKEERIRTQMARALQDINLRHRYTIPALRYELEQFYSEKNRLKMKAEMKRIFMMEDM